jgi:transposase InsO family protein
MAEEVTPMDIKMLIATLPEEVNLAAWCRQLGVSRQSAYKWRARYRAEGVAGLQERSRAPKRPAGRTAAGVEDQVVAMRKQLAEEGLDYGPASVRDRLETVAGIARSDATVWRILTRRGQINPQPAKRPRTSWRRFVRERPNECWQGDDTHYLLASGQEVKIINMLDDHSRLNVDSLAVALCRSPRIWEAFSRAVDRYGIPAEFLNDNGRAWRSADGHTPVTFEAGLAHLGVTHLHSSPYHPQTCGKVERFHQTQRRWLNAHPTARTLAELQTLLDTFRDIYNHHRPHRGIGRKTPAHVWGAQPPASPAKPAGESAPIIANCRVTAGGKVGPGNHLQIGLGVEWAGHPTTVIRRRDTITVISADTGEIIRELTIDPTRLYYGTGIPRGGSKKPRRPRPNNV